MLPVVNGLSAELIDPRLFPTRKWYSASPLWYYHAPRTDDRLRADDRFYGLIDAELQDLCRLLLEHGLRTTPSCQGHFYPEPWFREIWHDLERDRPRICGAGLVVTDSETGRDVLFRDREFELPWASFDAFFDEVGRTQTVGYLGFLVPPSNEPLRLRLEQAPRVSHCALLERDRMVERAVDGDDALFMLTVRPRDIEERRREWECATETVRALLEG